MWQKKPCPGCGQPMTVVSQLCQVCKTTQRKEKAQENLAERFWSKVDKDGPVPEHRPELGPCWIWTAGLDEHGYGRFMMDGRPHHAQRVAWVLTHGPIPNGLSALHHCDNRRCCNDNHLFLGTRQDNMADKMAKGRQVSPGPKNPLRGEAQPNARLTEADIREIRRLAAEGLTSNQIAPMFDIQPPGVRKIVQRARWKHIE